MVQQHQQRPAAPGQDEAVADQARRFIVPGLQVILPAEAEESEVGVRSKFDVGHAPGQDGAEHVEQIELVAAEIRGQRHTGFPCVFRI